MDRISALIEQTHRALSSLPPCENTVRRWLSVNQGGPHQTQNLLLLDLELPVSRAVRCKCMLFISLQVHALLEQLEHAKTKVKSREETPGSR